jgi:hypothetical protein
VRAGIGMSGQDAQGRRTGGLSMRIDIGGVVRA